MIIAKLAVNQLTWRILATSYIMLWRDAKDKTSNMGQYSEGDRENLRGKGKNTAPSDKLREWNSGSPTVSFSIPIDSVSLKL